MPRGRSAELRSGRRPMSKLPVAAITNLAMTSRSGRWRGASGQLMMEVKLVTVLPNFMCSRSPNRSATSFVRALEKGPRCDSWRPASLNNLGARIVGSFGPAPDAAQPSGRLFSDGALTEPRRALAKCSPFYANE